MKKKEIKKEVYEKIGSTSGCYMDKIPIPEGTTHIELEMDYSNCYYESDQPSPVANFFKKKEG
jgi:hypothetical protein